MLNKAELVKILETISRDKELDPDEAMKLTEQLLELFRQKPIIREVPAPCPYPHYPQPIAPIPSPDVPYYPYITYGDRTGDPIPRQGITICYSAKIIPASQGMPDPTLGFLD